MRDLLERLLDFLLRAKGDLGGYEQTEANELIEEAERLLDEE